MTTKNITLRAGENVLLTFDGGGLTVRTAKGENGVNRVRVIVPGIYSESDPTSPPSGDNPSTPPSGDSDTRPADGPTPATLIDERKAEVEATNAVDPSSAAAAAAVVAHTTVTEPTQVKPKTTPKTRAKRTVTDPS